MPRKCNTPGQPQRKLDAEFKEAYKQNLAKEHAAILDGEIVPVVVEPERSEEQKKVSVVFWMPPVNDGWNEDVW
jgi:hypothetical protein